MRHYLFGLFTMLSFSAFAAEYRCDLNYSHRSSMDYASGLLVISDNPQSKMGTKVLLNSATVQAFVNIVTSTVKPNLKSVSVHITKPGATSISNTDDMTSTFVEENQNYIYLIATINEKTINVSCDKI